MTNSLSSEVIKNLLRKNEVESQVFRKGILKMES